MPDALEVLARPRRRTARPRRPCARVQRRDHGVEVAPRRGRARPRRPQAGRGHRRARRARRRRCHDARAAPRASATAKRRRSSAIRSSRASTCLQARRVGFERGDEPVQVAADLAQAHGQLAELRGRALELGREPGQRLRARARLRPQAMPPRRRPRARRPPSPARRPRRGRLRGASAPARPAAPPPRPRSQPVGALDEVAQRLDARRRRAGVAGDLVVVPSRRDRARARPARASPSPLELLRADEGVQHVELVGGPREPPLLELARHRDQPLRRGGEILARDRAPPRVRPRAAVGEHAAREDEARLVLRPQLGERLRARSSSKNPSGTSSSASTYASLAAGPTAAGIALDAEQQPDRLGEDRLARAGLAAEHVEPGGQLELRLANEDEVLDPEAAQHRVMVDRRRRAAHLSR